MIKWMLVGCCLVVAGAFAHDPQAHYQARIPDSYRQALHQMETVHLQLELAQREKDLRKIHELSYELEASLEVMQAQLDAIAADVETMHVASEKNEKAKATQAYQSLSPKLKALSD